MPVRPSEPRGKLVSLDARRGEKRGEVPMISTFSPEDVERRISRCLRLASRLLALVSLVGIIAVLVPVAIMVASVVMDNAPQDLTAPFFVLYLMRLLVPFGTGFLSRYLDGIVLERGEAGDLRLARLSEVLFALGAAIALLGISLEVAYPDLNLTLSTIPRSLDCGALAAIALVEVAIRLIPYCAMMRDGWDSIG